MRKISTASLRALEVINLCGGEKLGYPCDYEFDIDDGKVLSIIVPVCKSLSVFERKEDYIIPWCKIECIGEDAILVRLCKSELEACRCEQKPNKKKRFIK